MFLQLTVEYNAAASLNIRINMKPSISFFSFLENILFAHICHTHAEVDFEVISVPVNIVCTVYLELCRDSF